MKQLTQTKRSEILLTIVITSFLLAVSFIWASDVYRPYLHNTNVAKSFDVSVGEFGTGLWTGAATYTYPIGVPPGTNGMEPVVVDIL